jgi:FtsP/CotA-like multicopper oxidase with cupredoxin domain
LGCASAPVHWTAILAFAAAFLAQPGSLRAEDSPELIQPPICSAATVGKIPALEGICEVTPLQGGGQKVKINLTANTGPVQVGGYTITTEHYNNSYLTPVVEALPGDTVAARLVNWLAPREHVPPREHKPMVDGAADDNPVHGAADDNPTNLHYFHGGIVTPRNSRDFGDGDARGDPTNLGDNVYVHLKTSRKLQNQSTGEFNVPIPGEGKLDARVLEAEKEDDDGYIAHPTGLGWYHSHLHGISSDQVMGGMSGLLSVGAAKENVKVCKPTPEKKCIIDVDKTSELRNRTEVAYVLLRDIPLRKMSAHPEEANGATAEWAPEDRDLVPPEKCGVHTPDGFVDDQPSLHKGFCQRRDDSKSAWLFTLNGQRFPTITVKGGSNVLLRVANVSECLLLVRASKV